MKQFFRFAEKCLYSIYVLVLSIFKYLKNAFSGKIGSIEENKHNDEIIVMGNGPSLTDINFHKIDRKRYRFCCVNDYPVKGDCFFSLKPEYLCLLDPAYFDFTIKNEEENYKKLLQTLENVEWDLKIIAPIGKTLRVENEHISYRWINSNTLNRAVFLSEKWFLFNRNLANPGMQNVVLGALYYFLSSNYKKIYVCGVDFSDFKSLYVDESNRLYVDSTHSYGTTRYYFDEMPEYGFTEIYKILGAYNRMFFQASRVRKYADYKKIEIINLSMKSYIDSFRKDSPTILEN